MATVDASIPLGFKSPTVQESMANMSSLLGVQQQAQALQQSQVKTQQDQATLAEQQALGALHPQDYIDPNTGVLDANRYMKDAMAATPRTGLGVQRATQVYQAQAAQTAVAQAGQDLNRSIRQDVAARFGAVKSDPNASILDYAKTGQQIKRDNPQAAALVDSYLSQLSPNDPPQVTHQKATALSWAVLPPKDQLPSAVTVDTGPSIAGGVQASPMEGGALTVAGQAVRKAPGPTQTIPYITAASGAGARAGGSANADIDTSNLVVSAQKDARTNIDLTKRIDQLADIVDPGAVPAKVSQTLGALGLQDVNQARSELVKDLGRLRGAFAQRAGSDSRAGEILEGLPTDSSPTQTIHQAMDITRGAARQDIALGQLREKSAHETQGQMNGFQGDYAHAVSAASPLMHEYFALSPQEQVGFFQRNFKTKEQARAFRAQAESVKKLSPNVLGQ